MASEGAIDSNDVTSVAQALRTGSTAGLGSQVRGMVGRGALVAAFVAAILLPVASATAGRS
jgi:hypothetical protein